MSTEDRCHHAAWQDAVTGELTPEGAGHLARCEECAQRVRAIEGAVAATLAEIPPVPGHLEQRVVEAARRERLRAADGGDRRGRRERSCWATLKGVPRWAMLCAGILLGATATIPLIGASKVVQPSRAYAGDQFTRECDVSQRSNAVRRGRRSLKGRTVVVAGVWDGKEAQRFKAVLRRFEQGTGARVRYVFDTRDIAETINARLLRNCPPDIAMLPQPGLLTELADGPLIPVDGFAGDLLRKNYSPAWRRMAQVNGKSYGVWFKAANKSNLWYSKRALRRADRDAPETWQQLKAVARQLSRPGEAGVAPFAIAGEDGWTLTDWFENVYLRVAGKRRYSQLARGEIPWTHPTVKRALQTLSEIVSKTEWLAGGTRGALRTSYQESILNVFGPSATAAMLSEGDFVLNELAPRLRRDVGVVPFPSIGGSPPAVVAAGDIAVLFRKSANNRAAQDLMRFFADPRAAEPWIQAGGFISPNKRVDPRAYRDAITRQLWRELTTSKTVRFDLSDLLPPAFGAKDGQGMWRTLQRYLQDPSNVDRTTAELQNAAVKTKACEAAVDGEC